MPNAQQHSPVDGRVVGKETGPHSTHSRMGCSGLQHVAMWTADTPCDRGNQNQGETFLYAKLHGQYWTGTCSITSHKTTCMGLAEVWNQLHQDACAGVGSQVGVQWGDSNCVGTFKQGPAQQLEKQTRAQGPQGWDWGQHASHAGPVAGIDVQN